MLSRCQQVKSDYDCLRILTENFLLEYEKVGKGLPAQAGGDRIALKRLKREWEISYATLEEKIDEDQIALRDRIGKELKFDFVGILSKEGVARVKNGGKYYFIDKTGAPISDERFDDVEQFSDGVARVKMGDKWFYINKKGQRMFNG